MLLILIFTEHITECLDKSRCCHLLEEIWWDGEFLFQTSGLEEGISIPLFQGKKR